MQRPEVTEDVMRSVTENTNAQERRTSDGGVATRVSEGAGTNGDVFGVFRIKNNRRRGNFSSGGSRGLDSITVGDRLKTSRGWVRRSALQPTPYLCTTPSGGEITLKRDNILPTDEGSRIGVIFLPRVSISVLRA